MKNVKTLAIAAVLSSLSFASFAAVEVQSTPADQQKVGSIAATAGPNLASLEQELSQKADAMGAEIIPYHFSKRSEHPPRYCGYL